MPGSPRIVLLHATPIAMDPIHAAFERHWPEAELINLLDDGLTIDRAKEPHLSDGMIDRFVDFGRYGWRMGADAILVTCSAFGPAIDRLSSDLPVPVLKPNEAMFKAAIASGQSIGMLATFAPAVRTMTEEFQDFVKQSCMQAQLTTIIVDDAIDLLRKGRSEDHNRLVAERAVDLCGCDAIMLAHFSTSRAADAVRDRVDVPVLTAPDAAVRSLKDLIGR
ncbi:MAG TPA: aspartate/glutamate racemase family protein [Stellaceae bacterium]|nr:aspartate/glutamate racemase family protein [Stellaceae bacterium]